MCLACNKKCAILKRIDILYATQNIFISFFISHYKHAQHYSYTQPQLWIEFDKVYGFPVSETGYNPEKHRKYERIVTAFRRYIFLFCTSCTFSITRLCLNVIKRYIQEDLFIWNVLNSIDKVSGLCVKGIHILCVNILTINIIARHLFFIR